MPSLSTQTIAPSIVRLALSGELPSFSSAPVGETYRSTVPENVAYAHGTNPQMVAATNKTNFFLIHTSWMGDVNGRCLE